MSVSIHSLLLQIKKSIGSRLCYMYGDTVRDIISGQKPKTYNIFIKTWTTDRVSDLLESLPVYKNVRYSFGNVLTINDSFTVNMLYLNVDDVINKTIEINSLQGGLRDFNKSSIKFSKECLENFEPIHILEAIRLCVLTGFHLDPKTITHIFTNKNIVSSIDRRELYKYLCESVKLRGTRKFISLMNTLGVSDVLFEFKLTETSIVNHFNSLDTYEFFAVILSKVNQAELRNTLICKCGFRDSEVDHVIMLSHAINQITDETQEQAKIFAKTIQYKRIPNASRLLRNLGYKNLSKLLKKERYIVPKRICINSQTIRDAFGIENKEMVAKLLSVAHQKVSEDPEYNNQNKLLTYLNIERKKYAQKSI